KVYVTGENGYIVVMQSGPKPVILAKNDMGNSCVATPAISDGCLYIRTLDRLFCVSEAGK
ncbi:MAG: serine/threonine protein kinase, partial [Planctomycetaceae bacterium]